MSDDYGYDQAGYQVSLDAHDRGKNSAQALDGYPLEVTPQGDWPGTSGSGDIQVNREAALQVADWLDEQARLLASVPGRLSSATEGVKYGPSTWIEANHLSAASSQVTRAVSDFGQQTIQNLSAAAAAIRTSINTYSGADHANKGNATAVQTGVPDNITTGGSGSVRAY